MADVVTPFDRLPKGDGYNLPSCPTSDAATDKITSSQHVPDSHNETMNVQVVSVATSSFEAPANPAPYWNSGEKQTLDILE